MTEYRAYSVKYVEGIEAELKKIKKAARKVLSGPQPDPTGRKDSSEAFQNRINLAGLLKKNFSGCTVTNKEDVGVLLEKDND